MILGALADVGGQDYLARQADENPVAFMGLLGKVLPLQLAGADGGALTIQVLTGVDRPEPAIEGEAEEIGVYTIEAEDPSV